MVPAPGSPAQPPFSKTLRRDRPGPPSSRVEEIHLREQVSERETQAPKVTILMAHFAGRSRAESKIEAGGREPGTRDGQLETNMGHSANLTRGKKRIIEIELQEYQRASV